MLARASVVAALLYAACLLAGCAAAPERTSLSAATPPVDADTRTIYVVRRKWHIDVGFEASDLDASLKPVSRLFPSVRYVFFGFGDRHYFLAKKHGAPVLLSALWPGEGLVLVTELSGDPQAAFGASQVIALKISAADFARAQDFVWTSLKQMPGASSRTAPYAPGPYEESVYLAATPHYSALHTCNTWAAEVLAAGGFRIQPRVILFAGQLWSRVSAASARASLPTIATHP